jgi:hypothetical protein
MSSSVNPKPGMSPLGHVPTSSSGICIPYVQLAAYVPYRVPPRGPTRHVYILPVCHRILLNWPVCARETMRVGSDTTSVTPSFKAKTRCSSYVCPGSSYHTYGQNVSTENQCLYYIISYYKNLLQVQKGLNNGMNTILPQADDRGFRTPRRSLHQCTPHLLSNRA